MENRKISMRVFMVMLIEFELVLKGCFFFDSFTQKIENKGM
jgi:hypothetical protein